MAHRVDTVTVAIDWRLMVIAMQLRFFVRPLGFPKRLGRDEVVALRMSFNRETLATIRQARGCDDPVLTDPHCLRRLSSTHNDIGGMTGDSNHRYKDYRS